METSDLRSLPWVVSGLLGGCAKLGDIEARDVGRLAVAMVCPQYPIQSLLLAFLRAASMMTGLFVPGGVHDGDQLSGLETGTIDTMARSMARGRRRCFTGPLWLLYSAYERPRGGRAARRRGPGAPPEVDQHLPAELSALSNSQSDSASFDPPSSLSPPNQQTSCNTKPKLLSSRNGNHSDE